MLRLRSQGRILEKFSNVDITLALDTVASVFSVEGYLDLNDPKSVALFKPFSYSDVIVEMVDDETGAIERLITGIALNPGLSVQKEITLTKLSGYSKTGVFEDVSIPPELYPLQTDGIGLGEIAKKICDYFKIELDIFPNAREDAAKPLTKAKAKIGEKVKPYLSNIAQARNITVAHDNFGRLLLYKVLAQIPPKVKINENDQSIKISTSPNGQGVHSDITVIKQASTGDANAGQATVTSPFVPKGIKRPLVVPMSHGENIDVKKYAENIACREAKAFPITIKKQGWTIEGETLRSGFYIELTAPSIFIEATKLVIQTINFKQDPQNGKSMTLVCVLPCVYTGVLPSKSPFK